MGFDLLLSLLIFIASSCSAADDNITSALQACKEPRFCKNKSIAISYPFHLFNEDDQFYCGYDGYEVNCDGNNPVINILNDEFLLKNVSYKESWFTVVDSDVEASDCPMVQHSLDTSTVTSTFDFQPDKNVFLGIFVNCSDNSFLNSSFQDNTIRCYKGVGGRQSYVIELPSADRDTSFSWNGTCEDYDIVPVAKRDGDNYSNIGANFASLLKGGFVLNWKESHSSFCGRCQTSEGYCGYNKTIEKPLCICNNGSVAVNAICGSHSTEKKSISTGKKALIGIGSALGFIFLAIISVFILMRCKKKKGTIPSSDSRSISNSKGSVKASQYFGVRIFPYAELEEATNHFDESREIGDGGFGAVYYGKLRDGRIVAVKRLYESNYRRVEQFMNEVGILARLSHRHLVTLYGCTSQHSRDLLLVYEYIENGTVADHLNGKKPFLPWKVRMSIAVETASALTYLHASDVIHRDVKTSNILLDDKLRVKVADFGLSRFFPLDATHVSTAPQGTPGYVDPEYHECYQLTEKSDVYSFGVVLAELISSLPAVDITRPRNEINLFNLATDRIGNKKLKELVDPALGFDGDEMVERMISAVAELTLRCLKEAKEERPSMDELYESLKEIQAMGDSQRQRKELHDPAIITFPMSPVSVVTKWSSCDSTPLVST